VNENAHIGGVLNVIGVATAANTAESTDVSTGGLITAGGLGVAKNSFIGGTLSVAGIATAAATTTSTSVTTGALVSAGGLGVNENAYIGGVLNVVGVATAANTVESTDVSTGGLITAGGLGVAKNAFGGGAFDVTGLATANYFASSSATLTGGSVKNMAVGVGGAAAGTFTTLGSTSGVVDSSDRRFKKNITAIASALDKVGALEGVQYLLRTDEFPEKAFVPTMQLGFIAQDVEEVLPEVVTTMADGYKAIRYAGFAPVLANAVNELHAEVKVQQKQITEQQEATSAQIEANSELHAQISALEEANSELHVAKSALVSQVEELVRRQVEDRALMLKLARQLAVDPAAA
jgi:hypothetical protein